MKQLSQSSFVLFTLSIQIYTRLSPSLAGTLILPDYINGMRVSLHRYRNNCPDFYSCSANTTTTDLCCVPKYGLLQLVLRVRHNNNSNKGRCFNTITSGTQH
ncbi:hypothetical protein BDF19DRAFT_433265 [Syncephalis fuscata]|nr:hypothetical protein BDF19DRAFT_433265 [Syncephalis fuscata]